MKIVNVGFEEFFSEGIKEKITSEMKWTEGRVFKCAESIEEIKNFIDEAIEIGKCALDLETTGLNTRLRNNVPIEKIVGIGLSFNKNMGLYIPLNHQIDSKMNLDEKLVLEEIKRLCQSCITIYQNAKFDLSFLRNYGVIVQDYRSIEDTYILAHLYDAGMKGHDLNLKELSKNILKQPMIEFKDITKDFKRFDLVSPKIGCKYAAVDPVCTLELKDFFENQDIVKNQKLIYDIEKRLVFAVMEMESNYVKIDVPYLKDVQKVIENHIKDIEKQIHTLAGKEFNIGSSQQLGKLLFDDLSYTYPEKAKTASGQYSTSNETLEKIADTYPIVKRIIDYRTLEKINNTYVKNLLLNHDENDCIKLGFNQCGTDTGRFSSPGGSGINEDGYSGMNVQSTPKQPDENYPEIDIRKAIISREGKTIVAADYENEEMRIATNLSKETVWIEAVNKGIDFHTSTAGVIYNKSPESVTKAERKLGKCVAKGTLIACDRGNIPIEQLKKGDKVITHTGKMRPITGIHEMGIRQGVEIITDFGHKIVVGLNHRFLIGYKTKFFFKQPIWKRAEELDIGQKIKGLYCGEEFNVEILEANILERVDLMDLTVAHDHTYIAHGLITHNTTNFLALYLGGPFSLAAKAKIALSEAKKVLASYFAGVPKLKKWMDTEIIKARKLKYVKTIFGRMRPLDKFYSSGDKATESHGDRCAINTQIQGAAADLIKIVMVKIYNWIHTYNLQDDVKMLITMHDELVFEITTEKLELYVPEIAKIMMLSEVINNQLNWPLPLTVDIKYGTSWRAEKNFFKDFPHTKDRLKEPLMDLSKLENIPVLKKTEFPIDSPVEKKTETDVSLSLVKETPEQSLDNKIFTYTIKNLSRSNLRWLNIILPFLKEEKDESGVYKGEKKILRLKDNQGHLLLVDEPEIYVESFNALAKFLGI